MHRPADGPPSMARRILERSMRYAWAKRASLDRGSSPTNQCHAVSRSANISLIHRRDARQIIRRPVPSTSDSSRGEARVQEIEDEEP